MTAPSPSLSLPLAPALHYIRDKTFVLNTWSRFENYFSVAYLGSNCIGTPRLSLQLQPQIRDLLFAGLAVLICTSLEHLSATVKMISGVTYQPLMLKPVSLTFGQACLSKLSVWLHVSS